MEKLNLSRELYASSIGEVKARISQKAELSKRVTTLNENLLKSQTEYVKMLNAQKILSTVSDDNTQATLGVITGLINKVLYEIFPEDPYTVDLKPKLYAGSKPHLILELKDAAGHVLDVSTQNGAGIAQIICFMYSLCLVEIRKGRKLIILDERLNGLHKAAKRVISRIIELFAKSGYQFVLVEYGMKSMGKVYNVEKRGGVSSLVSVEGEYDDEQIYVSNVDLSSLDKDFVEDTESE